MVRNDLRNIAIIAHVDHGKTTLVDQMLKQAGAFRENQVVEERVMDSGDIERERGITILAKNTSVHYKGVKINIVDTPGHADFSGEVERILKMVDGVVLLVDAAEGPMPQTRFVLQKALEFGHKIIIAINKIDRPDARLNEIGDEVLELLLNLDATDEQLDSPIVYCSGRAGTASMSPNTEGTDLTPLFEQILEHIPAPQVDTDGPTQMLVSSIDYNDYVGRIGIGRIERGSMKVGQQVTVCDYHGATQPYNAKVVTLYTIEELERKPVDEAKAGEIVCFSGIENVTIGETLCDPEHVEALPFVNKIFLTRYAYPGLRCVCRYNPRMLWPVVLNHNVYLRYERFDLVRWLNEGGQGSDFELGSVMDDLPPEYVDWLYDGGISINYDLNDLMTRQLGGTEGAYPQGYW